MIANINKAAEVLVPGCLRVKPKPWVLTAQRGGGCYSTVVASCVCDARHTWDKLDNAQLCTKYANPVLYRIGCSAAVSIASLRATVYAMCRNMQEEKSTAQSQVGVDVRKELKMCTAPWPACYACITKSILHMLWAVCVCCPELGHIVCWMLFGWRGFHIGDVIMFFVMSTVGSLMSMSKFNPTPNWCASGNGPEHSLI